MKTLAVLIICGEQRQSEHTELSNALGKRKKKRYFSGIAAHLDPPDLSDLDLILRINSCRRQT